MTTNTITLSDELYRIFGIHPATFGGSYSDYLALLHPDDHHQVDSTIQTAYQNHQPYSLYYRIIHPQNGARVIHGMGQMVIDEQSNTQYMIGTIQDITDLKRTEEALAARNKYLTILYQITLDLLNRREIDNLLKAVVDAATAILDAPYGEIMIKEVDDLVVRAYTNNQSFLVGDRVTHDEALLSWQAHDTLQPAIVENYMLWSGKRELYAELQLYAVAEFPITIGGNLYRRFGNGTFTKKLSFYNRANPDWENAFPASSTSCG